MPKLIIILSRLCALCPLLFASYSYAYTSAWTYLCDFNWQNESIDMNAGGVISPLDLTTMQEDYQQPVDLWCYSIPDDTSTSGQHVKFEITSQSTEGTTLALSPSDTQLSKNTLPIDLCLGTRDATQLCLAQTGDTVEYAWGGSGSKKPSLAPLIFDKVSGNDPNDPCSGGKGGQSCSGLLGYRGPYTNIAHVHFMTNPVTIAAAPPAPGKYTDTVTASFNGNLGTEMNSWILPSAVNITGQNNPTIILTATLKPDCRIESAPDVSMSGNFSSKLSQTQQISLICTNTTPYTMSLSGTNDITGWHQMKAESGNSMLRYQIYSDAGHSQIWNNSESFTGTGLKQTYSLYYATDPSQTNLSAGDYQDTETLTVTW